MWLTSYQIDLSRSDVHVMRRTGRVHVTVTGQFVSTGGQRRLRLWLGDRGELPEEGEPEQGGDVNLLVVMCLSVCLRLLMGGNKCFYDCRLLK